MRYLIALVLCLFILNVQAKNYYVSKTGSDTNNGTENAPFLSIAKASLLLMAGDTCFVKAGVYHEIVEPKQNGENGNPIVYTAFQNDSVVISASDSVANWQVHSSNIYKAAVSMNLGRQNMVFCNGEAMEWARWPNNSDNDKYTVEGLSVSGGSGSTIESSEIDGTNWTGGYVWYLAAHSGTSWTREITSSKSGEITFVEVDIHKWPFNPHNPTVLRNNNRGQFYIFGTMTALDHEREWYYNAEEGMVYFQAPGNVDPNTLAVEIGTRERTMNIAKNYIHIDGLNAFAGKVEITGEGCELRNGNFKNCLQILDELDNTDAQVANAPVHVRGSKTLIQNNVIDGSSLNGIYVQGWNGITEVSISNNLIKNCNTVGIHASPIRSSAAHVTMLSNTILTTGRDGIYCGGTDCEIAYNDVSDCMRINNDGGVFYTVGNSNDKNNTIHHNWFHDSWGPEYADGRCAGIYLDNNSKGYSVHHNVVWNITWTGIQINWDNWNIDIYNNSIYNVSDAMGRWENGYTIKDLVIKNNYASNESWIGTDVSLSTNVINENSPFRSLAEKDFRPTTASGLIDNGEVIAGISDDFSGAKPDIGAYEDALTPWVPGLNSEVGGQADIPTSTTQVLNSGALKIYPNPVSNKDVSIEMSGNWQASTIEVFNNIGQLVSKKSISGNRASISRETFLNSGIYLVKVTASDKSYIRKLIVNY